MAGGESDGPVVMLNLNRYRERADYEGSRRASCPPTCRARRPTCATARWRPRCSGGVGGRILWHTESKRTVIGDESDRYDEILAVWYPSLEAFAALVGDPGDRGGARRTAPPGSSGRRSICCDSGAEPVLTGF